MKITRPNVFHLGIPKSGSTSIQTILENDKRIELTRSRFYTTKEWWEKTLVDNTKQIVIESNETLISGGFQKVKFVQTVERMYRTNPNAQIIIVLRNQPDAILSMYKYHIKNGFYGIQNFNNWLLNTDLGIDYLSLTLYGNLVTILKSYFSINQINLLLFEELKYNPKKFYQKFYKILNIDYQPISFPNQNRNSFTDNELYSLVLFHYFSFNKKKSENPNYSKIGFKIEQIIRFKLLKVLQFKVKKDFFKWKSIENSVKIYDDFSYSNQKLINLNLISEADFRKYKYPL